MKKIIPFIFLLALGFFIFKLLIPNPKTMQEKPKRDNKTVNITASQNNRNDNASNFRESIFLPYWIEDTEAAVNNEYDKIYYFGVTADRNGIDINEAGYEKIKEVTALPIKQKILVVRIMNEKGIAFLSNKNIWPQAINELMQLVEDKKFQGMALDMEISVLPFNDTSDQINTFVQQMYTAAKKDYKTLSVILYGDTFYRKRPYNMSFISDNSDEVMVMAYDFHKAGGEPGPNFQYDRGVTEGYDFKTMTKDFLTYIPPDKLTVIFGMYGYDWTVDKKDLPIKPAKALSLNEIRSGILTGCEKNNCQVSRDERYGETQIIYSDNNNDRHIVWFEDEESVKTKTKYLKDNGIGSIAYWAEGYF